MAHDVQSVMDIDMRDADAVINTLTAAAAANREAAHRHGAIAELGKTGKLVATGDLHDHSPNLQRILKLARLDRSQNNHVVLHEVIHGPNLVNGYDLSIRMLVRVAALKAAYPEQVMVLQSNHELAQLNGEHIMKDRSDMVLAFEEGVGYLFHDHAERVIEAVNDYVRSLLLGVRCANGLFMSHSLPSPRHLESFDTAVIDREPTAEDLADEGSAHLMVWGRNHTDELADALAEAWGVNVFVTGHQPAEMGWDAEGERIIILASDHEHGVALPLDLSKTYDLDALINAIMPLNAVKMG